MSSSQQHYNTLEDENYNQPGPSRVDGDKEFWELDEIKGDRVRDDGSMEFYVSWEGYSPDHNSWEPVSSFEACPAFLSDWLKDTDTRIPTLDNIETVVSFAPEGGFIVKRSGQVDDAWCPMEMMPFDMVREFTAADRDIDELSDDDAMQIDQPASVAHSVAGYKAASSQTLPQQDSSAAVQDLQQQVTAAKAESAHLRGQLSTYTEQLQGARSSIATADQQKSQRLEQIRQDAALKSELEAQLRDVKGQNMSLREKVLRLEVPQAPSNAFGPSMQDLQEMAAFDRELKATIPAGTCYDLDMPGHAKTTHECRDPGHDVNRSTTSCAACVAKVPPDPEILAIFRSGVAAYFHPACNAAFEESAEGQNKDYLCNCQNLPRCSQCFHATVTTFGMKAAAVKNAGLDKKCGLCDRMMIHVEEVVVRCAVCLGMMP
ncbi:hypothetical protein CLAFUR0_12728 [Fulvia fulva]|nr:hypothetical protein CLAFUR0_12728 [Fulvia fulva]